MAELTEAKGNSSNMIKLQFEVTSLSIEKCIAYKKNSFEINNLIYYSVPR